MNLSPQQKTNRKEYFRRWHSLNKDRCAATKQIWASKNRDKTRAAYKKWLSNPLNKLKAHKRQKEWRDAHFDHRKQMAKAQYLKRDKEKMRSTCRKYYHINRLALLERERQYRISTHDSHKDHRREVHKRWREKNRGRVRANANKRRALEAKATVNLKHIKEWMIEVRNKPTSICYYCGKRTPSNKVHFDHIIAIARGGEHSVNNLCVSCKSCNLSKKDKSVDAWVRIGQQVLSL